tara:strand:+ start:2914 stop:3642 length:729 start_codon:yes stop_codon:yes gene_type:complete
MFEDDTPVNRYESNRVALPIWGFLLLFLGPGSITIAYLILESSLDITTSSIIALAVMNGSINGVIAWLTIRLDGHSNDALEHLDIIMGGMEELDATLDEANEMVESFTTDIDEAKNLFTKVGVDLSSLDLEPIAEVVEKLKENKDELTEILDHLKDIDVTHYIDQVKRIHWQQLLDSAEEIMSFIQSKEASVPQLAIASTKLPNISSPDIFEEEEDDFFSPGLTLIPPSTRSLNLSPPKRFN